jgi:murein DD-endopeptidase MepM/ murein hydrolase activator NlpD
LKSGIPWEPGHKVIRAYGNQKHPTTGQYMTHNGIDIGLTPGDPLYAPYDCKIIAINQNINDPSGLYIVF